MVIAYIPDAVLRYLGLSHETRWHANVAASHALLLCGVMLTPALTVTDRLPHLCLVRVLVGAPCPGCGITTCLRAASAGEFERAADANPAGLCLLAGLLAQVVLHTVALCRPARTRVVERSSSILGRFVLVCLIVVWVVRLVS